MIKVTICQNNTKKRKLECFFVFVWGEGVSEKKIILTV